MRHVRTDSDRTFEWVDVPVEQPDRLRASERSRSEGYPSLPPTIFLAGAGADESGPANGGGGLPSIRAEQPHAARERHPGPILVVDDDIAIQDTLREILESEDYPVAVASNGAEALRVLERVRPSLVLLDMRMPVLDGWGFARELARRDFRAPVLVMTAAQDARRWAAEIGADGYLAKPFSLTDLLDTVERLRAPLTDD